MTRRDGSGPNKNRDTPDGAAQNGTPPRSSTAAKLAQEQVPGPSGSARRGTARVSLTGVEAVKAATAEPETIKPATKRPATSKPATRRPAPSRLQRKLVDKAEEVLPSRPDRHDQKDDDRHDQNNDRHDHGHVDRHDQNPVEAESDAPRKRRFERSEIVGVAAAAGLIFLTTLVAFLIGSSSPEVWASRSEIEYRGRSFVETAAFAASSRTAVAEVAERFDLPVIEITESFTVAQAPNTEIIQLEFQTEDEGRALDILQALTDEFIVRVGDRGLTDQIALVQTELDRLQTRLDTRSAFVNSLGVDSAAAPLATASIDELGVIRDQIAELELRLVDLQIRQIDEIPVLVTEPYLDPEPAGGAPLRTAALGALAGAAVAAAVALALKR